MPFGPALVQRAARERLVPIVMTTLATAAAFLPFAVRGSIPGLEILHPMAVVVIGGLITATLVNLFIVPSLYLRYRAERENHGPSMKCRQSAFPRPARPRTREDGEHHEREHPDSDR